MNEKFQKTKEQKMSGKTKNEELSAAIESYKKNLNSVQFRGLVQEEKGGETLRILFDVPSSMPPIYAEVNKADVLEISRDDTGERASISLKRGSDFILSIAYVAGNEEDLPVDLQRILSGDRSEGSLIR